MDLLLFHCPIAPDEQARLELVRRGHRVLRWGFDPANRSKTIHEILAELPGGFRPDAIVCWSIDYEGVPEKIEEADAFTIAQVNDYHLAFSAIRPHLSRFDAAWTDSHSIEIFRKCGVERFITSPMYSYAAEIPPIALPTKDLDLVFVGGMNHAVHRERSRWLRRIARLADKYRVLITGGIYGEEYYRTLARGKLIFNHSVRGEMNMRCFEAPMLGGLPLLERGNREAPLYFPEGEAHVYYGENDLEEKIAHFLEHEEERRRIVDFAAHTAARMKREQLFALVEQIEPMIRQPRTARSWGRECESRRDAATASNAFFSRRPEIREGARAALEASDPGDAASQCALAFGNLLAAGGLAGEPRAERIREAIFRFGRAAALRPAHLPSRLSLATIALENSQWSTAAQRFRECLNISMRPGLAAGDLEGLMYPAQFDDFWMSRERIRIETLGNENESLARQALLLRMRAAAGLALALGVGGDFEGMHASLQAALDASRALGDPDPALYRHAALLAWKFGDAESAIEFDERADALTALAPEIWKSRLNRLVAAERLGEAKRLAEEYTACCRGYALAAGELGFFAKSQMPPPITASTKTP